MSLKELKVGDYVIRNLKGTTIELVVTKITRNKIICGPWAFDNETGGEIDDDLDWDRCHTGSYITPILNKHDIQ